METLKKNLARLSTLVGAYAVAGAALAQTYTTSTSGSAAGSMTPGVPNTGVGGDLASSIAMLAFSAGLVASGAAYLYFAQRKVA